MSDTKSKETVKEVTPKISHDKVKPASEVESQNVKTISEDQGGSKKRKELNALLSARTHMRVTKIVEGSKAYLKVGDIVKTNPKNIPLLNAKGVELENV